MSKIADALVPFAQTHQPPDYKARQALRLVRDLLNSDEQLGEVAEDHELVVIRCANDRWDLGVIAADTLDDSAVEVGSFEWECPADLLPGFCAGRAEGELRSAVDGYIAWSDGWMWLEGTFSRSEWKAWQPGLLAVARHNLDDHKIPAAAAVASTVISLNVIGAARDRLITGEGKEAAKAAFISDLRGALDRAFSGTAHVVDDPQERPETDPDAPSTPRVWEAHRTGYLITGKRRGSSALPVYEWSPRMFVAAE